MAELKLRCKCGATFEMGLREFINPGGRHDERHRVFIAELRGEEWLDRHQNCQPLQVGGFSVPMIQPGPATCSSGDATKAAHAPRLTPVWAGDGNN
jgi:hypothetical protein